MSAAADSRASHLVLRWANLRGIAVDEVLRSAGLSLADVEGDEGIQHAHGMLLWEAMERLTGDAFVGLHTGALATLDFMGMVGPIFATSPDLRGGLGVLGLALPLMIRNASISVFKEEDAHGIEYMMGDPRVPHGVDSMLAAILVLARECTGHRELAAAYVEHQSAPPTDVTPYLRVFGVVPRFRSGRCRLAFAASDLDRPFRGHEPAAAAHLVQHAPVLLRAPATPSFLVTFERALLRSIETGNGSLDDTARILGLSVRTAQRRLAEHNLNFFTHRTELRMRLARQYLENGEGVSEVAKRLGYTSRSAFSRAYSSWTGSSPSGRTRR
jgi:AraC-like DNA-binding protein